MAEATIMVLKDVDLGCKRCHKKIKKLLNKIPEILDWTFFEKENAVMIKVVSSSPENIKKQLLSEGGETIKKIEVLEKKPKPPADKPKGAEEKPPTPVRGCPPFYPTGVCCNCKPCSEGRGGSPCHHGCGIPCQPPSHDGYVRLVPSFGGWTSGCRCNRSCGGCRCEIFSKENPTCTIL
ncbi:uncharacterized protein LOC117924150 [Vitis riparia]|uniref:uncharacterized protein LOC117924150 n=1 Tax=Vitis riparia TaxID=96939 RepID=UPI00155AA289|nr:uncharacterized protein LOC117924150 [Vitis riparia]